MKVIKSMFWIIITVFVINLVGCKLDVTKPQWDNKNTEPPIPVITSVSPDSAIAGVNYITIYGSNFLNVPTVGGVYFNTVSSEVVSSTDTEIIVRRPSVVGDSITVKVSPSQTYVVGKYNTPYNVDDVVFEFGDFTVGTDLDVIVKGADDNLYVIYNVSGARDVIRITPTGEKTTLAASARPSRPNTDAIIGPDGRLYLMPGNNRTMSVIDLVTETFTSNWLRLPPGNNAGTGAFDAAGYFYVAGKNAAMQIVDPSLNISPTSYYATDEVISIRIFKNNLYALVKSTVVDDQTPELAIWKHIINGSGAGSVSDKELFLDLSSNEITAGRTVSTMELTADGDIYLGLVGPNPLITLDVSTKELDYLYKEVLPTTINNFTWGSGTSIYTVVDDISFSDSENPSPLSGIRLFRIDTGVLGAH